MVRKEREGFLENFTIVISNAMKSDAAFFGIKRQIACGCIRGSRLANSPGIAQVDRIPVG
jgi:hypothetical protein